MIPLRLDEVAAAVRGRLTDAPDPGLMVSGPVVVDSRAAQPGSLFVAVRGERRDGHDFAAAARAAGAVAVLAARPVGGPAVLVPDPVAALGALARAVLDRLAGGVTVVGVTGSSGKTGTKDLCAQVLARRGPTVAPPGSYNNEIGVPLTVLRADRDTRHLVLEMGARGVGHIRRLCEVAPPRVGVVLNVGSAHLGEFGSRERIAEAKGELVAALPADGWAVLNGDDPLVAAMAKRTAARVITWGQGPGVQVRAERVRLDGGRPVFWLRSPAGSAEVRLGLVGPHQVGNAVAAAAASLALGQPLAEVAEALGAARSLSPWRMEVHERPDGVTVVNDAYNANPESMRAALEALVALAGTRRTWAVLGEMRELGEAAPVAHAEVGRWAARLGVGCVVAVGAPAAPIHDAARAEGACAVPVPDGTAAVELLSARLAPGDVVLVKASRAAGLERVADALREPPGAVG
ncbi:MAG: UDP-N-acetylmuramoyl-tripeptide--D-alanyl-D-alanine ligase [Actinomycetota bacterium]